MKRDYGYWEFVTKPRCSYRRTGKFTERVRLITRINPVLIRTGNSWTKSRNLDYSGCNVPSSEFFKETTILWFTSITITKWRIFIKEIQGDFYMPTFRNTVPLHRQVGISSYLPAYEDGRQCFETSTYKIQIPGNYPEESIEHSEHGESLKSRIRCFL